MIGHFSSQYGTDSVLIEKYWGTVVRSMETLFQFVTLDDWAYVARRTAMSDILPRPWLWIFFVGYIFLTSFLILSLMTGVVSDFIVKQNEDYRRGDSYEADVKFFHKEMKKLFVGQTSKHHHKVEETAGGGFFHCCLHSEHVHEEHQDVPGMWTSLYLLVARQRVDLGLYRISPSLD